VNLSQRPTVLVTGFAGFIGTNLVHELSTNFRVVGIDNFGVAAYAEHYVHRLKSLGAQPSETEPSFSGQVYPDNVYYRADVLDLPSLSRIVEKEQPQVIVHLGALTGVRQSFENPAAYVATNITGTVNVFEVAKQLGIKHLLYASSSSVYGQQSGSVFAENDLTHSPLSIYGATKLADELMAHTYYNTFGLSSTGFRFFTVYGPWNRPDMAAYLFLDKMKRQEPITLFHGGKMVRDFTYVGDVVQALKRYASGLLAGEVEAKGAEVFNIGGGHSVFVEELVAELERASGYAAIIEYAAHQAGDMTATGADTSRLESRINYRPDTSLPEGIARMVKWFKA
jgi:UDP-glucuronate 4-epimerase